MLPRKKRLYLCQLSEMIKTGLYNPQCPPGWLPNGRNCFTVRRTGLTWDGAQHSCKRLADGSHLADLKTLEDLFFVSSQILSHSSLLLLWTGLSDQQTF
uniref:C-type lectin domain-containing protein n=1 Tax=Monopterus albus TaxID=43700 RepID=A0A3Q3QG56_MONAL